MAKVFVFFFPKETNEKRTKSVMYSAK